MQDLFENTSIKKAYFTLALPIALSMLVTLFYNMVDTYFVAKTGIPALVAGVSQGAPLFTLMIAIGDIFGIGGSSLISRLFGEKRNELARNVNSTCCYAAIICGIIIGIALFIWQTPFIHMLGASQATWKYAREYYLVIAAGAPFIIFGLTPTNTLRTEGLAVQSMISSMVGTVINIFLNPFFIFTCGLGAAGSALATVTSTVIGDVLMVYFMVKKSHYLSFNPRHAHLPMEFVRQVLEIGIPASIINLMTTFAAAMTNRYLIHYGADSVAAMGIAIKVSMIISMIFVGFAYGAQPLIGYTYGAKDKKRYNETIKFDLQVVVGFALVMTIIIQIFAPQFIRFFMNRPTIVREGTLMVRWLVSSTAFAGAILVFTTTFQSLGKAVPAFLLALARQGICFYIALVVLNHLFGYTGILAAQAAADTATLIIGMLLYQHYRPRFNQEK
ncbi:MATE family efflux transporter [Limosilactobacillus sp.]|uniref:MATE family efflux transporter n=1 Tax=Limosilactobacillus sp. TaxID=2773925 RepID=UPI00345EE912